MSTPAHPAAVSNRAMLSLDGFFARLQDAGFLLRPDDYAEILQVITTFSPQTPDELAELIAPLLVTSEEEQQRFYALFAEYQRAGATVVVEPPTFRQRLRRLGWYWVVPALVLCSVFFWYITHPVPKPSEQQTLPPDTAQPSRPVATNSLGPSLYLSILSSEEPVRQASKLNRYHISIPIVLLGLCVGLSIYLFRRARRQAQQPLRQPLPLTDRFLSQRPPYTLPLPNRESELILPNRAFNEFVTTLRHRSEDEVSTLNITQTLSATVRSGGLPALVFSHRLREEEFLFLIDNSRIRGQQLHLFEFLYHALSRESVCVERFFYQVPFGQCRNERFPNGLSLSELATRYQTSTLVIWGDGYPLLFDDYDVINPAFLNELRRWNHRAILTPVPFPDWDHRERALQAEFLVLPADVAGQLRLMQAFHDNQPDQTAYLNAKTNLYSTADVDFKDLAELHTYLGDDLFQWLCATAVYGKVRWEVLIEMGRAVLAEPYDLSITSLLKLARIAWLRDGNFPDAIRLELLKALRPDNELKARQTLLKLLYYADVKFPDGYFFDEERYLLRTTNQFALFTHQPEQYPDYASAAQAYKQLWQDHQLPDGTMRLYLENPTQSWDNLLGTGTSRVRLADQFTTDRPATVPPIQRWVYLTTGIGVALLGYVGYLLWQKPAFALVDEPVTYTFVFRPNKCMTLADFKTNRVMVTGIKQPQTLTFQDTTATVSLTGDDSRISHAFLRLETPLYGDTASFPLSEQRHTFEVRGENCVSTSKTRIEIFYSVSNLEKTKYLADRIGEVLGKETDYEITQSPLSRQAAARYNVTQNEIRYDNENEQEYAVTVSLQKIINSITPAEAGQAKFRLVRVMKQKTPQYISIFITQNKSLTEVNRGNNDEDASVAGVQTYTTNNARQAESVRKTQKAAQRKQSVVNDRKENVAQTASVKKAPDTSNPSGNYNNFVFNTGKPIKPLKSTEEKNSLQSGVIVPGAPWVLVDVLQFDVNQQGAYELVAATSPYDYPSSQYTAYLLPASAINQQKPLNPDGKYGSLAAYLSNRLSVKNMTVTQIQKLAQLPAYQDPSSIKSLVNVEQSQKSARQSVWVFVMASVIDSK